MKKRERRRKKIGGGQGVVVKVDDHVAAADPEGEDPDLGQGNDLTIHAYTYSTLLILFSRYRKIR